jgi:cold shock protein
MAQGCVLWFSAGKGYGFIRPDGGHDSGPNGEREIFVHASAVEQAGLPGWSTASGSSTK